MTPEGRVKNKVKKLLKAAPSCYYHMPVLNGMGTPTLDFVGCSAGRFFAIETKADSKALTPRQVLTVEAMTSAGATVFVVIGEDSPELIRLSEWLVCS